MPPVPALAAQLLYPEIFVKPRDEYMQIMLREIMEDPDLGGPDDWDLHGAPGSTTLDPTKLNPYENILAYIGNVHLAPLARTWNTVSTNSLNAS